MDKQLRYSDLELEVAKNTFADNEPMLCAVRKIMLGLDVTETERTMVSNKMSAQVKSFLARVINPVITGNEPTGMEFDLWLTLDVSDRTPEQADIFIAAKEKMLEMIESGLKSLETKKPVKDRTTFKRSADPKKTMIDFIARNLYVLHIKNALTTVKVLAGLKTETVEEQKTRMLSNSSK